MKTLSILFLIILLGTGCRKHTTTELTGKELTGSDTITNQAGPNDYHY